MSSDFIPFDSYSTINKISSSDQCYKVSKDGSEFFAKITSIVVNDTNSSNILDKSSAYKNLSYPSVSPFLEVVKDGDQVGYISPFYASNSLKERLSSLNNTEKTIALYGFANALKYLKNNNIIPANLNSLDKIIFDGNNNPILSGFYFSELDEISYEDNDFLIPPEIAGSQSLKESSVSYIFGAYAFLIMSNQNSKEQVEHQPNIPDSFPNSFKETIQQCLGTELSRPSIDQVITKFNDTSFLFSDIDINKFRNYQKLLGINVAPVAQKEAPDGIQGFSSIDPLADSPQHPQPQPQSTAAYCPPTRNQDEQYVSPDYMPDAYGQPNPMDYADPYQQNAVFYNFGTAPPANAGVDYQSIMNDAKNGNPNAMFEYGKLLYDGQFIPQNLHKAAYYFKQAGKRGNANGEFFYGFLLENGHGVPQNLNKAVGHFCKSAHLGSADGNYKYGLYLDRGLVIPKSREGATFHFRLAAEQGHPLAMYRYGYALAKGRGIQSPNLQQGANYIRLSADTGLACAQSLYGYMLLKGIGVDMNTNEALRYIKLAADQKYPPALNLYAEFLAAGKATSANPEKALQLFEEASSLGDGNATNNIGKMYQLGLGVPKKDEEKAVEYFYKSANEGNVMAMVNLGICYFEGKGVKEDQNRAYTLFDSAAKYNNKEAMVFVGVCKENGFGTKKNEKEAYEMYDKAADANNCAALYHKGRCLLEGIGVKKNKDEGKEILKLAQDLGSERANRLLNNL